MNEFQKIMKRQNKTAIEVMNIAAHELAVENMSPEDYETWEQGEKLRDAEIARIIAELKTKDEQVKAVTALINEWRFIANEKPMPIDRAIGYETCAKELQAALAAAPK